MQVQLKLYGSSKMLSDKEVLHIKLPNNSNVEKLRSVLSKIISEKCLKNNRQNLSRQLTEKTDFRTHCAMPSSGNDSLLAYL